MSQVRCDDHPGAARQVRPKVIEGGSGSLAELAAAGSNAAAAAEQHDALAAFMTGS
jgi:hypothetical protein